MCEDISVEILPIPHWTFICFLKTAIKAFKEGVSTPTYITHKIFDKDYAAIHEIKAVLMLKKPIYVGFTVLDLSKWKMYDFH